MTEFDVHRWNDMRRNLSALHQVLDELAVGSSFMGAALDTRWAKMNSKENQAILKLVTNAFSKSRLVREQFVVQRIDNKAAKLPNRRQGQNYWEPGNKHIHYDLTEKGLQLLEETTRALNCNVAYNTDTLTVDMDFSFTMVEWHLSQPQIFPNKLALVANFDPKWDRGDELRELIMLEKLRRTYVNGSDLNEVYA